MGLDNPLHIAFLVVILLLVFGARRLPEIGRSLGSGMREFKDSVTGASQHQATLTPGAQPQQQVAQQPLVQQQPVAPEPVVQQQPVAPQPVAANPEPAAPTPDAPGA
jgi:sec-independent protein translocase protein TatA